MAGGYAGHVPLSPGLVADPVLATSNADRLSPTKLDDLRRIGDPHFPSYSVRSCQSDGMAVMPVITGRCVIVWRILCSSAEFLRACVHADVLTSSTPGGPASLTPMGAADWPALRTRSEAPGNSIIAQESPTAPRRTVLHSR